MASGRVPKTSMIFLRITLSFEDTAEIENHLVIPVFQPLELVVCYQKSNNIRLFVRLPVIGKLKHLMRFDIGFYNQEIGVVLSLHHLRYNIFGRRLPQVFDIRLEGEPHQRNNRFPAFAQAEIRSEEHTSELQ